MVNYSVIGGQKYTVSFIIFNPPVVDWLVHTCLVILITVMAKKNQWGTAMIDGQPAEEYRNCCPAVNCINSYPVFGGWVRSACAGSDYLVVVFCHRLIWFCPVPSWSLPLLPASDESQDQTGRSSVLKERDRWMSLAVQPRDDHYTHLPIHLSSPTGSGTESSLEVPIFT